MDVACTAFGQYLLSGTGHIQCGYAVLVGNDFDVCHVISPRQPVFSALTKRLFGGKSPGVRLSCRYAF